MNWTWRRILHLTIIHRALGPEFTATTKLWHNFVRIDVNKTPSVHLNPIIVINNAVRFKSKKVDSDDEEEDYGGDNSLKKDSKVVKFSTTSLRTDLILKSALSIARNKIEQHFYESRIRVNGKKIMKKSATVKPGDEIDVIKMVSPKNPEHIYVARIEILNIAAQEDSIAITARRFKNLLIENYEKDPFKGNADSD